MGIKQVLSAPHSLWQRAYIEQVTGTIRRECLDHMVIFSEHCLYRHPASFFRYYHRNRKHPALEKQPGTSSPPTSSGRTDHSDPGGRRVTPPIRAVGRLNGLRSNQLSQSAGL